MRQAPNRCAGIVYATLTMKAAFFAQQKEATMAGIGLPLMSQLKDRMHWLQSRQKVLAENVANADSPGYKPRDLRPQPDGRAMLAPARSSSVQTQRTDGAHIRASIGPGGPTERSGVRFETVPTGNAITLETEMMKLAETQMDYQTAASLYTKSLSFLKIAIGKRA
jgi:flagellar basal-body rod protein FlgB